MDLDSRGVLLGFLGAAVVLGALLWFVGFGQIAHALRLLNPTSVVLILAVGFCWLFSWGLALRQVLDSLDVQTTAVRGFLLYASAAFANNITPFGQAGGEPFSALLISRATDSEYETGLAAIASVDTLNFIPSIVLAGLGLSYYIVAFAVGDRIYAVAVVVAVLAVAVPAIGYAIWRNRERLEDGIAAALAPVLARIGAVVPTFDPPDRAHVRRRVATFFVAIERVASEPLDLATALLFSALGWLCMCAALYVSLQTLVPQMGVPAFVVFVVVPVATIASITPLPGGAGGVEVAIVLLLVPFGVTKDVAAAAAIVYRAGTYWFSTLVGGVAAALLEGPDAPWEW